jgi:radical SAM superfamily enzyme YgiQ (UPF0313 family)
MDVVICNFPPMLPWYLPAAPAILAGACQWLGLASTFIDFNQETSTDLNKWAETICKHNPKLVAFSIFTYKSREIATNLARIVKSINPKIKFIVGGSGIKDTLNGERLLDYEIFDYYIDGDGEQQWPNFLIKHFNIDCAINFNKMELPYTADYSGYDTLQYLRHDHQLWIPVTGSRGCVRRCTFCEVHQHWKFQQRDPASIINEIENILKNFSDVHIHFTDSLVNGSIPTFMQLLDGLTLLKQQYPLFTWGGQFIIRNKKQCHEEYWSKIANSGAEFIEIGVETGSNQLRNEMGKHFTNDDLDHSLAYMSKFNISCVLMFFVGYPTETLDDFEQTLILLDKYKHYAGKTITVIQAGYSMVLAPGTPLYDSSVSDTKMILSKDSTIWFNQNNPTLTYTERYRRRVELSDTATKLGYTMTFDDTIAISEIENNLKHNSNIIAIVENKFGKNN